MILDEAAVAYAASLNRVELTCDALFCALRLLHCRKVEHIAEETDAIRVSLDRRVVGTPRFLPSIRVCLPHYATKTIVIAK